MAKDIIFVDKQPKIQVDMPKQSDQQDTRVSDQDVKLKDQLMKLIIETKDEPVELKITGDQYRKMGIHDEWRQVDFNSKKAAYFSYQEKAAKDFIFRFNKCGILSDQVGMGKTIEAGMIISELAFRKELQSLLILVPNENMAEKWENELSKKFGFRNFYKDVTYINGKEEKTVKCSDLPRVYSIKSMSDLYSMIYTAQDALDAKDGVLFESAIRQSAIQRYRQIVNAEKMTMIRNTINRLLEHATILNSKEFKLQILKHVYSPLIEELVRMVSIDLGVEKEFLKAKYHVDLDGPYYHIIDMYMDTNISSGILVNGIIERLIDQELIVNSLVNEFSFVTAIRGEKVLAEISRFSKKATTDHERLTYISRLRAIAEQVRKKYAILIVSKIINRQDEIVRNTQFNLLDFILNDEFESESTRYCSTSTIVSRGYRTIDMLIDMAYRTLIVDEAHDYIKVSHKQSMKREIAKTSDYYVRQLDGLEFSDLDLSVESNDAQHYYVFPLYNDYYFVKKDSLFVKVKTLAERSYRKIFMTATPIKSDMVDFYLLYLLADNHDTNTTNRIRRLINTDEITRLANLLLQQLNNNQKKSLNYLSFEDLVVRYFHALYLVMEKELSGKFDEKIAFLVKTALTNSSVNLDVLKKICVNKTRNQFQRNFTIKNEMQQDVEIHTISDLVTSEEGIEQWKNMYSQIGIRSTRHQTFQLDEEHLKLLKVVQRDKYRNLPIWSRRNGVIVYVHKKDNYFDLLVKEILNQKKEERRRQVVDYDHQLRVETIDTPKQRDLQKLQAQLDLAIQEFDEEDFSEKAKEAKRRELERKYEMDVEKLHHKYEPKERALEIYQYINRQLTGELLTADYFSTEVDYDEFKLHMVVKMMTDGLEIQGLTQPKKVQGKILLFSDASTKDKVYRWLTKESDDSGKTATEAFLAAYYSTYKHQPLWYYNSIKNNPSDRWVITSDIKALNDKSGNFLIVVEPDKYEEGVDLQSSNILINFDIKFCPLKMEQRVGRIDRVKLNSVQSQLEIISFTPLNDMSGFMVDFLANELKMFSCWKGDTTGIVSMPLGNKPNSATFEDAILLINEAYKALYAFDVGRFVGGCKRLLELGDSLGSENQQRILAFTNQEKNIDEDMKYLKGSGPFINEIVYNTDRSNNERGDEGKIIFGDLCILAKKVAVRNEEISAESVSNHKNDLKKLNEAIKAYYEHNVGRLTSQLDEINKIKTSTMEHGVEIGATDEKLWKESVARLQNDLIEFRTEQKKYTMSHLALLAPGRLGIDKVLADLVLDPILGRYKKTIMSYLGVLIEIFEKFCADVSDRSIKMSRFISLLTIEEFKVMAENYE